METTKIDAKLVEMRAFLERGTMQNVNERKKSLKLLYKNIKAMQPEIYAALKADLNKSEAESYMTEVMQSQSANTPR